MAGLPPGPHAPAPAGTVRVPLARYVPDGAAAAELALVRGRRDRWPAGLTARVAVLGDGAVLHYWDVEQVQPACGAEALGRPVWQAVGARELYDQHCPACAGADPVTHARVVGARALVELAHQTSWHADAVTYQGALAGLGCPDAALAAVAAGGGLDALVGWVQARRAALAVAERANPRQVCWPLAVELAAADRRPLAGRAGPPDADRCLGDAKLLGWLAQRWEAWALGDPVGAPPVAEWHAALGRLAGRHGPSAGWLPDTPRAPWAGEPLGVWVTAQWHAALGEAVAARVATWQAGAETLVALTAPVTLGWSPRTPGPPGRTRPVPLAHGGWLGAAGRLRARWPAGPHAWTVPLVGALWLADRGRLAAVGAHVTQTSAFAELTVRLVVAHGLAPLAAVDVARASVAEAGEDRGGPVGGPS